MLNGTAFELGVLEDVGDDVDSLRDVLAEALRVVNCLLTRSVRIEVGAEILHFDLEGMLGVTANILESHMLKEVGHATGRICLGTQASDYPHTHRRGLDMGMCLCHNSKTI